MEKAYLGVDIGSISTKGVVLDADNNILASDYLWTEGDPIGATKRLAKSLESQLDAGRYQIVAAGTTGSARKLVGTMLGAVVVKNEITAHAVGTTTLYPDVRTIFEIGGQDSKIILIENGVVVDYAMNTLCAAAPAAFCPARPAAWAWRWRNLARSRCKARTPPPSPPAAPSLPRATWSTRRRSAIPRPTSSRGCAAPSSSTT